MPVDREEDRRRWTTILRNNPFEFYAKVPSSKFETQTPRLEDADLVRKDFGIANVQVRTLDLSLRSNISL